MPLGDLAELAGEVGLPVGGEVLVAEEDHMVGVEGPAHLGHHGVTERPREVEAMDLRSDER